MISKSVTLSVTGTGSASGARGLNGGVKGNKGRHRN